MICVLEEDFFPLAQGSANFARPVGQIQPPAYFYKWCFIGTQLCVFLFQLYMTAFALQEQAGLSSERMIIRLAKPKAFTFWLFTEKVA